MPLAWALLLFFGLGSFVFYGTLTFVPSIYRDSGYSATEAGLVLTLVTAAGAVAGPTAAWIGGRMRRHSALATLSTILVIIGLIGMWVAPESMPVAWAIALGSGQGATFGMSMGLIVWRSRDSVEAAGLAAMVQSGGYLIAALGPVAFGYGRTWSGSWALPLVVSVVLMIPQLLTGWFAGKPRLDASSG